VDFVVAGILLGSLAVVVGELVRVIGPKRSAAERKSLRRAADPANTARAWKSACHAIGLLIATAGAFLLLLTLLMTLFGVSDSVGWIGVALIGAVATGAALIGSWSILNHYRSGGFDPVLVTERQQTAPAIPLASVSQSRDELFDDMDAAIAAGMVESAWIEIKDRDEEPTANDVDASIAEDSGDGLEAAAAPFAPPAPATWQPTTEPRPASPAVVKDPEPDPEPVPNARQSAMQMQSAPTPLQEVEGTEEPVTAQSRTPVATQSSAPIQPIGPPGQPAAPVVQPREQPNVQSTAAPAKRTEPQPTQPVERTGAPDFATPNFEYPLIDLEEELPAWNAIPLRQPPASVPSPASAARPIATPPPSAPGNESQVIAPEQDAGGFKSSLLADVGTDAGQKQSGRHFSSSLLNELTADLGPPRPADDIVLDEFSLPADDSAEKPSGATGR
jgi:hypothetical protein